MFVLASVASFFVFKIDVLFCYFVSNAVDCLETLVSQNDLLCVKRDVKFLETPEIFGKVDIVH